MQKLFDTSAFPPRWHCGTWSPLHGWTHVVADTATALAYFTIPLAILLYLRRRPRVSFRGLHLLFAGFIVSCGTVHLIEATIFWQPWYRLSALAKVATACVSWMAVVAVVRNLPVAARLPELAAVNASLRTEITARERTESELRRRNEELDEFVYVASHDLKAPLRAIKTLARWVEEDGGGTLNQVGREHLVALRERVGRMEALLADLLQYSRVGRRSAPAQRLDTPALVTSVVDLLQPPNGFTVEVQPDLPRLVAPTSLVTQVFQNLLANALVHHDRETGHVRVRGRVEGDFAEFTVEDDGPGIPESARSRAFALFQSLHRGAESSSGVGLALVKKIVETLGGRIWLEAVEPESRGGRGTRVRFTLPLEAAVRGDDAMAEPRTDDALRPAEVES